MPAKPISLNDNQLATLATLQLKLNALGVDGAFAPEVVEGPIISLYKFAPGSATRVSSVEKLSQDLAIALGVEAVQIRRIPGEAFIGIAIPNKVRRPFPFKDMVDATWKSSARIPLCLGVSQEGHNVVEDLALLPHLLIAGSTGSGKSTLLSAILSSLIYCRSTSEIVLLLSDTKQVEFGRFEYAPHLWHSVANTSRETLEILEDSVVEIETRLKAIARCDCKNLQEYNQKIGNSLPYIVIVIDELVDLLTDKSKITEDGPTIAKQSEHIIGRIAARARAAGVHMICGTQRPSVKVVEGNIKANFPARISFRLPSEADSRTILGQQGAENLLSQGDMLYLSPLHPSIRRIHSPFASAKDMEAAVEMAAMRESR